MRGWVVILLVVVLAATACAPAEPDPTAQMCAAAAQLEGARLIAAKAAVADQSGASAISLRLAQQARDAAQQSNAGLQAVASDELKHGETWQALLAASGFVVQAANALLPGYENTHGMTDAQLASADRQFATAQKALPPNCFLPGINQPGSAGP